MTSKRIFIQFYLNSWECSSYTEFAKRIENNSEQMKNDIAQRLSEKTNTLIQQNQNVTNLATLKYVFFEWLLFLGYSEIEDKNNWLSEIPANWSNDCSTYTIRYRSRKFYVLFGEFPVNFGFNIVIQDSIQLQSTESRSIYELPIFKPNPTDDDEKKYCYCVSTLMGVFSRYFSPFLDRAVDGKKPVKRAHGSSSSSVVSNSNN